MVKGDVPVPLESPILSVSQRVTRLNSRYKHHAAFAVLNRALSDPMLGRVALVSSFGAESVVLLHMISTLDRSLPILSIDTELLFAETLTYQTQLATALGLSDIRRVKASRATLFDRDPDNILHHFDIDACCALRKIEPLQAALKGFDAWITGRKRYQGANRHEIDLFEAEDDSRIKINPLAHWSPGDLNDYITNNNLPRHPLVSKGFPSVGCMPCTQQAGKDEDARAGRWRGLAKTECGIHFAKDAPVHKDETMNILVSDTGFQAEDWKSGFHAAAQANDVMKNNEPTLAVDIAGDLDVGDLMPILDQIDLIRIDFPAFTDGRGFSQARRLRTLGFAGRLRAFGPLVVDQYSMARRAGFDEVEITPEHADRQPEHQWLAQVQKQSSYQHQLRQFA
jgi:phosphoadenosine phosphosulfate reductase